ncbi:hypothetical protein [Salinispira pacifica]|uniref:PEGA domain-containing protein n=1 Tax=Salinispira pacifica TaxID=1307761 RepID=V5WF38_9SPIO|nr:hypothetical protein [Salinispira pacifica]AHC14250.1 hypothetical protein L21SP2_0828 [Salinispira pacifica]
MIRAACRLLSLSILILLAPLQIHARGSVETFSGEEGDGGIRERLEAEYSRTWKVAVLPFISDDTDVLRSIPLAKSMPEAVVEALTYVKTRSLSSSELEGYEHALEADFTAHEQDAPAPVLEQNPAPRRRNLAIESVTDLPTSYYRSYARGMRAQLRSEGSVHPRLLTEMSARLDADLFIGGHVQIQEGYAFVDIMLISPYIQAPESPVLASRLFSIKSIEALDSIKQYISREIAGDLYNAPFASLQITLPRENADIPAGENGEQPGEEGIRAKENGTEPIASDTGENTPGKRYRVYVDDEYRGTAPALLSVLDPGLRRVQVYLGSRMVVDQKIQLDAGETAGLTLPPPGEPAGRLALHTIPRGTQVFDGSSFLGVTPLLLDLERETRYLQLRGEGVQTSYLRLPPDAGAVLRLRLPPDSVDWKLQMQRDRRQFYGALGVTLVSGLTSLIAQGVNLNLSAADFQSWPEQDQSMHRVKIYSSRTLTFTASSIALLSLVYTGDQLIQYLRTAEQARGVLGY